MPQRATITNMGAELGATSSIFPSDEITKAFLTAQGREEEWIPLVSDSDASYTVVLDTNLTEELVEEGFVREILSKIQTMRKDSGFEVQDNISVLYFGSDRIDAIIKANKAEISAQALAVSIEQGENSGKEWNINGEKVTIAIEKA